jgi:hypothetical protein
MQTGQPGAWDTPVLVGSSLLKAGSYAGLHCPSGEKVVSGRSPSPVPSTIAPRGGPEDERECGGRCCPACHPVQSFSVQHVKHPLLLDG